MIIDVTERVETAKRLTAEWAERAGYQMPSAETQTLSKKARDLQRIMNVSSFGCQQKNVHALLKVLVGEDFSITEHKVLAEYAQREPLVIGSVLVPLSQVGERAGQVVRLSEKGNAGLRQSNGDMIGQHFRQDQLRPATNAEIDAYFAETFGLAVNELDCPTQIEPEAEFGDMPF